MVLWCTTAITIIIWKNPSSSPPCRKRKKRAKKRRSRKKENQSYYRSKQQRSEDAKRRNRLSALEKLMEQAEAEIETLQQEIASPELASDYTALNEKCERLEQVKLDNEAYMEEWLELSEG